VYVHVRSVGSLLHLFNQRLREFMGFRKYMGEIVGEIAGGWVFPPRERHKWAEYVFFFFWVIIY